MASIVYSAMARADITELWTWIAERDGERRAEEIVDRLDVRIRQLADRPDLGPARPEIHPDARSLVCGRWLILYDHTVTTVRIMRVVDGARDLSEAWLPNPNR